MYSDDDMLMLSGIQHFRFCPRQWALIHIEQQWDDNLLTVEGHILHKRTDDPFYRQKCGDFISLRSVCIASHELGLYGDTDVDTVSEKGQKRLRRVARLCQDYGQRVQNSVFECEVTEAQYATLKERLRTEMDEKLDSIRFYHLNRNRTHSIDTLGRITSFDVSDAIVL